MFTHLFQLWLSLAVCGIVILAIMTSIEDYREAKANRRASAADAYAREVLERRVARGEYNNATEQEIQYDYDFLHYWYLQFN